MLDDRERPPSNVDELRLTYAALGARLGITTDAARMLARRRGWQRIQPNRLGGRCDPGGGLGGRTMAN